VIAILEDDQRRSEAMTEEIHRLFPRALTRFFDNAPDMVAWLKEALPSVLLLCLDHDLGPNRQRRGKPFDPGIGRDVADFLATQKASCPVLIHSSNAEGAQGMGFTLEDAGWSVERVAPFDDLAWVKAQWSERVAAFVNKAKKEECEQAMPPDCLCALVRQT
jgi:hypothetical protein